MLCGVSLLGICIEAVSTTSLGVSGSQAFSYGIPISQRSSVLLYSPGAYCLHHNGGDSMFYIHMDGSDNRETLVIDMWNMEHDVNGM